MALDGIMFEGVTVRIRRPADYNAAAAAALGPSMPNPNLNLAAIGLDKAPAMAVPMVQAAGGAAGQPAMQPQQVGGGCAPPSAPRCMLRCQNARAVACCACRPVTMSHAVPLRHPPPHTPRWAWA